MIILISLLGGFLILEALLLYRLPVGECPSCIHCNKIKEDKAAKEKELHKELMHNWGMIDPKECGCEKCKERLRNR